MLLRRGESLVRSAYAVLEGGVVPESSWGPGVLYLTNHRLVFERGHRRGGNRRPNSTVVNSALEDVHDVAVPRRRLRSPRLAVELSHGRPTFDVLDPEGWASAIAETKRAPVAPASPPVVERITIERQVVRVRCRFCLTLASELDRRCPACGAPL
jgi:hypothetical protein